jgi:hypothetical protein
MCCGTRHLQDVSVALTNDSAVGGGKLSGCYATLSQSGIRVRVEDGHLHMCHPIDF